MKSLDEPRRTSGLTPILTSIDRAGQFLIPLVIIVAFRSDNIVETAINFGVITFLAVATSWVSWWRLRWWVEEDRLRVRSGLFRIDDRTIPVDRIQRVDRNQTLASRFFGLYTLDAETAGGSGSELSIRYLTANEIDQFEAWLDRQRSPAAIDTSEPDFETLVSVRLRDLILAGATANRIGALAVLIGTAFQLFDDATSDSFALIENWFPAIAANVTTGLRAAVAVVALVLVALTVGWIASIATTTIRFFEFKLDLIGDELRRAHGLLSRFQATSPIGRIQAVRIDSPLLRRLLGYSTVVAETAGSPGGSAGGSGVLTPISPQNAALDLTARVIGPDRATIENLDRVSKLTIRRGFIRSMVIVGAPLLAAAVYLRNPWVWIGAVAAASITSFWYSRARYDALGYRVTDDHIVTREGVLTRIWWAVPLAKVQTVAIRRSPFQRRLGLATLSVDTAGGSTSIRVIDVPDLVAVAIGVQLVARSTANLNPDAV